MNTAADFLSRTEVNPIEQLEMTIRNDIQTKAIEVNIQSSEIVVEEQNYTLLDDEFFENQLWQEKQNVRNQVRNETHNDKEHHVTERKPFQNPTSALNLVSEGHFLRNWGAKIERNFFNEIDLASEN